MVHRNAGDFLFESDSVVERKDEDTHKHAEDDMCDQFGSLACRAIWETLGLLDLDEISKVRQVDITTTERECEAERSLKPVIKLRYKRLFRAQLSRKTQQELETKGGIFPIILRPEQMEHCDRLTECLVKSPFAFDFSMMGTGKTYVSSSLYENGPFNFEHLICVVPTSVRTKWQYMHTNHGVDIDVLVSYSELRSSRFHQPKHGLLIRHDYTRNFRRRNGTHRTINASRFEPTEHYLNRVNNGLLLVIDEIQNIKNTNDQLDACRALVQPILDRFGMEMRGELGPNPKKSRIILLSGSPMDKKSQVIHFYRCLGIMRSDKLRTYNPFTGAKHDAGISEIKHYFEQYFPERYRIYCKNHFFASYDHWGPTWDESVVDLERRCYSLFQLILKPELSSSMDPTTSQYKLELYNGFFRMANESLDLLHRGIEYLKRATNYNSNDGTIDYGNNGADTLRNIQRALVMIETSKIGLLTRLAREALTSNPHQKVVIAVNYTETVNDLMDNLQEFEPMRMTGDVTHKKRFEILERFQMPSGPPRGGRLIIGNLTVLSTGIDLDDNNGNWPRLALVNPNYSAISLYQFGYRFHRAHTRSNSQVYFVFGDSEQTELPIIDSLARKGEVLKDTCDSQRVVGVQFPGNYPIYKEQ